MPGAIGAGLISYWTTNVSVVSPKFQPALNAVMFASRMSATFANRFDRNAMVESVGRPYIHDSSPSANMFLARAASLRDRPNSLTASTVMPVRSTGCTANSPSGEPASPSPSSGLAS